MLNRAARFATRIGVVSFAALTAGLIARMFWYLHLSMSNALRIDQWVMLEELWRFHDGRFGLSYLWTPYWGQRIVIPRLIFLADERWFHFSNTPLVWINVAMQCAMAGILAATAWRLLRVISLAARILALTVMAHLVFSSLQLENIVYGMSVQYSIGLAAALAAIALMGISARYTIWAAACALVSTLSLASGLFVWPILIGEALVQRRRRWVMVSFTLAWLLLIGVYALGYSNPGSGMGVIGMLRRPAQAFLIAALFLSGPLGDVRQWLGELVGAFGFVLAAAYSMFVVRRKLPPECLILTAVCWYVMATAVSIPLGRMTPEWIAARGGLGALPSRYFTAPFLFWGSAFVLAIYAAAPSRSRFVKSVLLIGAAAVVAGLTIGTVQWQLWESMDWLAYYRKMDAAASGFLIGASDPAYMSDMYPDQRLTDHWVPYLKDHHLSVFADQRATWIGGNIHELFRNGAAADCQGRIDEAAPAGGATFRLLGYVADPNISLTRKTDIVFADAAGRIAGVGRTMATSDARGGEKFVGYVSAIERRALTGFAVLPGGSLCRLPR
jgi:hypothetical protein